MTSARTSSGEAGPRPSASAATRIAALAVASVALACLGAAGGLRPTLIPAAAVAMTLTDLLTSNRSPRIDRVLRHRVMPLALVLCAGPALAGLVHAAGDPDLIRSSGARLAAGALVVMPLAGSARRDLLARLALATATAGLAATSAGSRIVLPGLVFLVAALALLALVERDRLAERVATTTVQAPTDRGRRPLAAALTALVVAAAIAVPVARALQLPDPHSGRWGRGGPAGTASSAGTRLDTGAGYLDLRQRGSLPEQPVAQVSTAEPLLWRTGWLTDYDGLAWRASGAGRQRPTGGTRHSAVVTPQGGAETLLLSPGEPVAVDPAPNGAYEGGTWTMPKGPYSVTGVEPVVSGTDATPVADDTADPAMLALPKLPTRVVDLARSLTADAATRAEAVQAVVGYLRQTYRYQLDSPVPPVGTDAVDDFLFRSREGFCEQFASAAAVLLRAVGVPTRLAVGYADGEAVPGGRLLRGTDAHAWIEVQFPGTGWVAFDPTAGAQRARHAGTHWWDWFTARGSDIAVLALIGVGVGAAVWAGLSVLRRRGRERDLDPLDRALRHLDRRLGPRRRQPNETLREFADRLPYDSTTRAAVLVAEQDRYAPETANASERRQAARALRRPTERRSSATARFNFR